MGLNFNVYSNFEVYLKLKYPIREQCVMNTCTYVSVTVWWPGKLTGKEQISNWTKPSHPGGDIESQQKFHQDSGSDSEATNKFWNLIQFFSGTHVYVVITTQELKA